MAKQAKSIQFERLLFALRQVGLSIASVRLYFGTGIYTYQEIGKNFGTNYLEKISAIGINPEYIRTGYGEVFLTHAQEKLSELFGGDFSNVDFGLYIANPALSVFSDVDAEIKTKIIRLRRIDDLKQDEINELVKARQLLEAEIARDVKKYFDALELQREYKLFDDVEESWENEI